ncbi:MAG: hypothetical protein U0270_12830 [Labilithrix sp.]
MLACASAPPPSTASAPVAAASALPQDAHEPGRTYFRRKPPPLDARHSVDACAYPSEIANACIDALGREPDPVRARYMRRISAALAGRGLAHAAEQQHDVAECCNDAGPCGAQKRTGHADCPVMDDGYACLTAAELGRKGAHARACHCSAERAQITVPGGVLACDGPERPVVRGAMTEASDVLRCASCDEARGPAACEAEIRSLRTADPELAAFVERVIVTRCLEP